MANFKNIFRGPRVLSFYNRPQNYSKREEAKDGRPSTIFFLNVTSRRSEDEKELEIIYMFSSYNENGEHLVQVFFVSLQK